MKQELLPCPFCGSNKLEMTDKTLYYVKSVKCMRCCVEYPHDKWNTRAPLEPALVQQLDDVAQRIATFAYNNGANNALSCSQVKDIVYNELTHCVETRVQLLAKALKGMLDYSERVREVWNNHQGFGNPLPVDGVPEVNAAKAALKEAGLEG